MTPKNFLFVSTGANITDIVWQVGKEGHNVKYFIESKDDLEVGDGFVSKSSDWKADVDWADVIIFDDVGFGQIATELRSKGKKVIGGTPYTDKLGDDRAFGQEELHKAGITIVPHKEFTSFEEAIEYVRENPGKYFVKPGGSQIVKELLFIGEEDDGKDVIQVLSDYQKAWSDKISQVQLQKKISGVDIAVGAFFNGKEFITPINLNFEYNNWFPGGLGPSSGEMGTLMFWSSPNKLFNATLKKFEKKLASEGYVGYIDLKCMVNSHGMYPLDWTPRFGYPTISIQQEGMVTPIGEFFYELASGNKPKLKVKSGFQVGVRLVVPPYPFTDTETFNVKSRDSMIYFKKPSAHKEGIHIEDVRLVNGEWLITGSTGLVLIVCGTGATVKQAQSQAYSRIKQILIPHMYYRTDIGNRWFEDSDKLHSWGYLREV